MRPKERINLFLDKMDLPKILSMYFPNKSESTIESLTHDILTAFRQVKFYWESNPDLRFSQVLVNMGLIPNEPGIWYYMEDIPLLIDQGIEAREVLFWGRNFDKDMNRLPKTEWLLIKNMNTDHIQAILDGGWTKNPKYLKAFNDELELRKTHQ